MSANNIMRDHKVVHKIVLSIILFLAMSFFFIGDHIYVRPRLAIGSKILLIAVPTIILLGLTLFLRRKSRFHKYWEVVFAYFCGSLGLFLAWAPGSWPEIYFGVSADTAHGVAILKFFELLPVALSILVLTKIVQGRLAPIYIQKGDLKIGLGLGLILSFLIMAVYLITSWPNIDQEKALLAIPGMLSFSLLDAFFEELLLRGLFIKRYIKLFGATWALILSTLCYGLFFLGVQSAIGPIPYGALIVILPLGLLYGFVMIKSGSIWGSVTIHAAVDFVFLMGVFASI